MKEETSTTRPTRASHLAPRERPIHRQGVLCRSKPNQSTTFVDPGDEECQGNGANTQMEGGGGGWEAEHKSECKNGDFTIAISQTSLQNTDNDAQQEPSHATFAKRSGTLREIVGENDSHGGGGRGQPVGLIQGVELFDEEDTPPDDVGSQVVAKSIGFDKREHHSWSSESSDDYIVMAIRRKKETLWKVARPKLKIYLNGYPMNIWIDSGLPISILTLDDLRKTVGRAGINLKQDDIEEDEFRDYSNNRIKMLGRMELELASNGWKTKAEVRVIGGTRPSIGGRDLMANSDSS